MIDPQILVVDDVSCKEIVKIKDPETRDDKAKEVVSDNLVTLKKLEPIPRPSPPFP